MKYFMSMRSATIYPLPARSRVLLGLGALLLFPGCAGLSPPPAVDQRIYVLDAQPAIEAKPVKHDVVLGVSAPQARPGFDTPQIAYTKQPHELNYFVTSRWADTPAHMLEPLLLQALEQTASFRAVVQTPGAVPADLRLDTEVLQFRHDFTVRPSRIQFSLRARLIDVRGKRMLAVMQFDEEENADSEDAYGGVKAANRALRRVLNRLTDFCTGESAVRLAK